METIYKKLNKVREVKEIKKIQITSSKEVYNYIKDEYKNITKELVFCVFVDSKNHIIKKKLMFEGGIDYSIIEPKDILKECILNDYSGFFMIHNHPSGNTEPSQEDKSISRKLKKMAELLNIRFLDNIIIGNDYLSFFEKDIGGF